MSDVRVMENENLLVEINDHGAELARIYDKNNKREIIWDANPAGWNRHAPVLFPSVGSTHNGEYRYNGNKYPMKSHGFGRDSEFTCVVEEKDKIVHVLKSSDETKKVYPFDFVLEITHILEEDGVVVSWQVHNETDGDMYFTIGAHPAFFVPAKEGTLQKDYKITFDGQDKLDYIRINDSEGTAVYRDVKELVLENGKLTIGEHLFDNGVLIFENKQVEKIGLEFPDGTPYVSIDCKDFPYVGIWSKPGAGFVCLEPWYGRCDNEDFTGDLSEKTGVNRLAEGCTFMADYKIKVTNHK